MTDTNEQAPEARPSFALSIRNSGEPLLFKEVQPIIGFTAEASRGGQSVQIYVRLALDSDEPLFHRLVEGVDAAIQAMAEKNGQSVNLKIANSVLLVMRPDQSAELWVDTVAVTMRCRLKRSVAAQSAIFENDIADIIAMSFPCVTIGEKDKVLYLFREGWSFGFSFDFNPDGKFDLDRFSTTLGTLYRKIRYRHLYQAVNSPQIFNKLLAIGWFPFVEIITSEFRDLTGLIEAGLEITEVEAQIIAAFDKPRLAHLLERWITKPHFSAKEVLLKEAIEAFLANRPASVIKIILTEIEGILNDAYRAKHGGEGAKIKELLAFVQASGAQQTGGQETLLFPAAFGHFLATHTFANFDPTSQMGSAGSRHAVGHGAAAQDSYTMTRALQAILTLDQLAFYT